MPRSIASHDVMKIITSCHAVPIMFSTPGAEIPFLACLCVLSFFITMFWWTTFRLYKQRKLWWGSDRAPGEWVYRDKDPSGYSIWGSSFSMPIVKPGQSLIIKMVKGPRPDPMPDGEFDAREV